MFAPNSSKLWHKIATPLETDYFVHLTMPLAHHGFTKLDRVGYSRWLHVFPYLVASSFKFSGLPCRSCPGFTKLDLVGYSRWLNVVPYLVASSSKSSGLPYRSCPMLPDPYPVPHPLTTPCPDFTLLSCFSTWTTWRRSCCHLLIASNSLFIASSTLKI